MSTILKGSAIFEEENHGAHYYAYSPALSTSQYSEAFANIVLPTSLDITPSGVPATYTKRNAYISLGLSGTEGGVDLGITNTGSGWKPVSYDTLSGAFTTYDSYLAGSTATNALIVVKPISSTKVGLYVNFLDSGGASVKIFDSSTLGNISVGSRTTWNKYYRFASLVQDPATATDYQTDSTYMLGGRFTNLGLYNTNTSSYSTWLEPLGLMSWADFLHLTFTGTCQWIFGIFLENGRSWKHAMLINVSVHFISFFPVTLSA